MPKYTGNRTTADWKDERNHTIVDKIKKQKKNKGKEQDAPIPKYTKGKLTSKGGISKIVMAPEDEEMMLRLITMLDSGELEINLASALPEIADTNCDSTDDDGDDNDDDDDDDDDDDEPDDDEDNSDSDADESSDDENFLQGSKGLGATTAQAVKTEMIFTDKQRKSLVRKLIRDDRKTSFDLACLARDDKVSRVLLARSMMISQKKSPQGDSLNDSTPSLLKNSGLLPLYLDETPVLPSAVVRVTISCLSKPGNVSKVVLVDRTETVEGLIEIARKKFTAPKKYSVLLILPEGTVLRPESLFTLPNGSNLSLAIAVGSDKVQSSSEQAADVAPRPEKSRAGQTPLKNDVNSDKPGGSDNPTDAAKGDYWSPPETVVVQAQKTPRRLGDEEECVLLKKKQETMFTNPSYRDILTQRQALPIHRVRKELLDTIRDNQFIVVSGETGSGKTTQLPAYLLEDLNARGLGGEGYIICTQPRRIAAITVATRVAYEMQESAGKTVGYQVRLDNRCGPSTRIVYCTTGVLLRRLQHPDFLASVSHIVVDEVHERQVETDFLMTLLKQNAPRFPQLRLIMMSATMQEKLFSDYFSCPIIYVEGRCFNVQQHYIAEINKIVAVQQKEVALERRKDMSGRGRGGGGGGWAVKGRGVAQQFIPDDKCVAPSFDAERVAEVVIRIIQTYSKRDRSQIFQTEIETPPTSQTGDAILVFLSGIAEISKVNKALRQRNLSTLNAEVHQLHSSLPNEVQKRVFRKTKPGEWKIVLSTNIAETSVTVEDVTHVVDCGTVKELRYDAIANMSTLKVVHISRASARQRAGRAGRVRPGHCWRLYSAEWLSCDRVQDYTAAEILRVPLEEVVLQVLLLKLGLPDEFLVQCLTPPSISQVRTSVASLLDIKAILPKPNLPLTALGYHLAQMPVDIRIGKMLIMASLLNCIEPALTVAAALAGKSPFTSPPDKNRKMDASRAHLSFTSSFNYANTAAKYSISLPEGIQKQADIRFKEDLTPPNDVFFSDHLAAVNAYNLWEQILSKKGNEAAYTFCRENYLSHSTFNDIMKLRENFRQYLRSTGFLPQNASQSYNKHNDGDFDPDEAGLLIAPQAAVFLSLTDAAGSGSSHGLMRCALCAGLFPQVVRASKFDNVEKKCVKGFKSSNIGPPKILQGDGVEVFVHPGSLTHSSVKYLLEGGQGSGQGQRFGRGKDAFIVYHKKVASDRVYLHDCTLVPAAAILLFGGDLHISRVRKASFETVTIGSWIHFKMSELHAVLFRRLQTEMESMLRIKVEDPSTDITKRQAVLVRVIEMLLE